jgi:hypothetical protein
MTTDTKSREYELDVTREVSEQRGMFSYVSLEDRVKPDHPLRAVKVRTEAALKALSPLF